MQNGLWRKRILSKLLLLKENPIPRGALKLRGEVDVYSVKIGDYRVLYKIFGDKVNLN